MRMYKIPVNSKKIYISNARVAIIDETTGIIYPYECYCATSCQCDLAFSREDIIKIANKMGILPKDADVT